MMGFQTCVVEYKKTSLFLIVLLTYFLWMDVILYHHIQSKPPFWSSSSNSTRHLTIYSPFNGLTMKVMMLNHASHYIYMPLGMAFHQWTRFNELFAFITPNMISSLHLVLAILAGKLVTYDDLPIRQMAVLIFEMRTFLDSLDGIVARTRIHQVENISNFGSLGHFVDGVTDTLGTAAFIVGIICYLQGQNLVKIAYSLLPLWQNKGSSTASKSNGTMITASSSPLQIASATNRKISFVMACFIIQIILSALLWERYIARYHILLESRPVTKQQALLQNQILKSSSMWVIIWFWKLSNALALMEIFLIFVFLDRIWEYLTWIQYVGSVALLSLALLTEFHYHYACALIGAVV